MTKQLLIFSGCLLIGINILPVTYKPNELLVKLKGSLPSNSTTGPKDPILNKYEIKSIKEIEEQGLTVQSVTPQTSIYKIEFTSQTINIVDVAQEYSNASEVLVAQPNYIYQTTFIPNDPGYPNQWGIPDIQATDAWDLCSGNSTIKIAIIDTGISSTHPDLQNKIVYSWNFMTNTSDANDEVGHGTCVAGIATAQTNNQIGISGVAPQCSILNLKACDSLGYFTTSSLIGALASAIENKASVINMSLGGYANGEEDLLFKEKVEEVIQKNIPVIAAAGNSSANITQNPFVPASYPNVIAVGAVNSSNQFDSRYSNYGSRIDLVGPGTKVYTTFRSASLGDGYTYMTGTSAAVPFVAGVVALIKSVSPNISISKIYETLIQTTTDLGIPGKDDYYGYGLVNANAALLSLDTISPEIRHTPITSIESNSMLTITANIQSSISWSNLPIVTLYYRYLSSVDQQGWKQIKMIKNQGIYSATLLIPPLDVTELQYLFIASDPKFSTTFPLQGSNNPLKASIHLVSGPVITCSYKDLDYLSKKTPLLFYIDEKGTSRNSIQVTITTQSVPQKYTLSSSTLTYSNGVLSIDIPSLGITGVGNIVVDVQVQDVLGNASRKSILFKVEKNYLLLAGPKDDAVLNAPNPFNPLKESTFICYSLSEGAQVEILIYSLTLQPVKRFDFQDFAGYHEVAWNGQDESGDLVPNGVYLMIIKASANGNTVVKRNKIAVLRK